MLWVLVPLLLWSGSALLRVHLSLADAEFNQANSSGLLKSDPGLLFYLTQRVVDAGGRAPDDWRADPRIEYPGTVDVPEVFTVGQEFLVGTAYRLFGRGMPLHVFCVWLMSFVAGAAVVGVFGMLAEQTRSLGWASFGGLLYLFTPANYRTVGFILIREDLSLPLYAMHLWALSAAYRRLVDPLTASRPRGSAGLPVFLATTFLVGALATWHGMAFFVALEVAAFALLFVLRGSNPFALRAGRLALPAAVLGAALVPALRTKLPSAPLWLLIATGLWVAAWCPARLRHNAIGRLSLMSMTVAGLGALAHGLSAGHDLAHVTDLVLAKLRYLGSMPDDPRVLPFDVRLMWQGPFATATPAHLWRMLLLLSPLALWVGLSTLRLRDSALLVGLTAAALALMASWLIARVVVLPGLILPWFVGLAAARKTKPGTAGLILLVIQGVLFARWTARFELGWYRPALRQQEIAAMVQAVRIAVPDGEPIAADFMNSTAILAHTKHPIVLQPKWERKASRERVEAFWSAFYHGTPQQFHAWLTDEMDCHYLLIDRFTLWILRASRLVAGLSPELGAPIPGTAAEALLDPETETPGFELIWRSPQALRQSNGRPSDFYRLYRLSD